mmetsp:Transcript_9333/g.38251  ORF Transcript_9333/g.38251 Transcript_9333/m.38251 type:complete len:463 (-) Transcript_9333:75-1463(-)
MGWRAAAGRAPLALLLAAVAAAAARAAAAPQDAEIREDVTNILTTLQRGSATGAKAGASAAAGVGERAVEVAGTAVIGGNREGADVGADAAGESDADAGSSEGTGAQNFGHISRQQGATLDAQDQGLENIFESASRDDYEGWLWDGPHQGFTQGRRGHGLILLQHVRKAGGTTLCSMLRQNMNATGADCMLNTRIVGITKFYRTLASFASPFKSLQDVREFMAQKRLEAASSEDGGVPAYAVPHDVSESDHQQWVFLTSMRDPIDRIVSAMRYEGYGYRRAVDRAKRNGINAPDLFQWVLDYGSYRPGHHAFGCHLDNYQTRVFARACGEERNMTQADFDKAAKAVKSYDICFVIEWLSEMAPLLKYLLGLEHLDASPRNVLAAGGPDWGHGRTDFVAELGRKRALERSSTTSHASKLLTKEQLARLREVHSWDVKLYRVCQRSAAALAKKHLFLPYVRHHL